MLDDNRVYRLTEAAPTAQIQAKKKKNVQQYGKRSSKRRRTERGTKEVGAAVAEPNEDIAEEAVQNGLGGMKWECIAISLDQVRGLIEGFRKSRDGNENILQQQLEVHLLPILEKQEESRKRRALQRDRDLANLAKLANAKRSSRIASKVEQQKQEEKLKEEEKHIQVAEQARIRSEHIQLKHEQQRETRMASRETRLKEREARRKLYTEELAQLSADDGKRADSSSGRASERRIQSEIEKNKQALEALDDDEEDWVFDCICGLFGQVDDGAHSVACETCNVWQHSQCLGISEKEAERPDFRFVCKSCRHREDMGTHQRPLIKLKVSRPTVPELQASPIKAVQATELNSSVELAPESDGLSSANTNRENSEQPPITSSAGVEVSTPVSIQTPIRSIKQKGEESNADELQAHVKIQASSPSILNSKQQRPSLESPASVSSKTPASLTRPFHEHKLLPRTAINTPDGGHSLHPRPPGEANPLSQAGISPTKQSSPDSLTPVGSKITVVTSSNNTSTSVPISPNTRMLPPEVKLAPSPPLPILTPPTKHFEPVRAPKRQ